MELKLEDAFAVLERIPNTISELLAGLPDEWLSGNEGPESFSPRDVVAHMLDGEETDWIPRIEIIRNEGTSRAFTPFDRFAFREKYGKLTIEELLSRFAELRAENLARVRGLSLSSEDLEREGRHPDLGTVTMRQLLATWAVHDLAHIRQIARVMAKQYREEVGPWERYFRVFQE
jgi:hypothetical protein